MRGKLGLGPWAVTFQLQTIVLPPTSRVVKYHGPTYAN
jgi:hypothetical protein